MDAWTQAALEAPLDARSKQLRRQIVRTLGAGQRGHLGAACSLVEILRVLFDDVMRYDPARPHWPGRDRFILSKGHGCIALYVMLAEKGFFAEDELWRFCQPDGMLGGHPDHNTPGVEASTGSLGHGLSIGVGMAIGARIAFSDSPPSKGGARGGCGAPLVFDGDTSTNDDQLTSHARPSPGPSLRGRGAGRPRVFVVLGDGESNEGSVWEAAMAAAKHRLDNLIVLTDYNKHQAYGRNDEVLPLGPLADKWRAFGFAVEQVNGHDVAALRDVLSRVPLQRGKPTAIICHTVKGKGVPDAENNMAWHHVNKLDDAAAAELLAAVEAH